MIHLLRTSIIFCHLQEIKKSVVKMLNNFLWYIAETIIRVSKGFGIIFVFYVVYRTWYQRKNPDPGFWHDDDLYFDGHSHFSIPLAGFLLNIVQPSDEFSEISPLFWVLLFGTDLEIAKDPV